MTEVKQYRKLPVEISAMELTQFGDFVRAVNWIADGGGRAYFAEASAVNGHRDYLIIDTIEGSMEAGAGWFVIQGVKGEFYPCAGDIFRLSYEAVEAPQSDVILSGTGVYVRNAPDSRKSLVGGAARALPRLRGDGTDGSWAGD